MNKDVMVFEDVLMNDNEEELLNTIISLVQEEKNVSNFVTNMVYKFSENYRNEFVCKLIKDNGLKVEDEDKMMNIFNEFLVKILKKYNGKSSSMKLKEYVNNQMKQDFEKQLKAISQNCDGQIDDAA